MDAFDADALIYAAVPDHPLGRRVLARFADAPSADDAPAVGVGSVLLLPELLAKPMREGAATEVAALTSLLGRLELLPVDAATAELATALGARYRLRAADAVHLATAVAVGADRFITNNTAGFDVGVVEIDVVTPADLPEPPVGSGED